MCANGIGISIVSKIPEIFLFPIVELPFSNFDNKTYFYVNRYKDGKHSEAADVFWGFIEENYAV
jgi:hypothetical protein